MSTSTLHRLASLAILLPALAACVSAPAAPRKALVAGASITLQQRQSARLPDGSTLRYVAMVSDSRCPVDVQCVWAGDADLLFDLAQGRGERRQIHLHTGKEPKSFRAAGHTIVLESVTPGSGATATIRLEP